MKEVVKERTHVEKYKVYQASDGAEFINYEECRKYEDSALGVVRGNVTKLIAGRADDAWDLMGGDEDNPVIAIRMYCAADVDLVKQLFLLEHPYYNEDERKELKQKKFDIIDTAYNKGDVVLFGINCEGDYYFINSRQNIIDNLNNLARGKNTQEK
jgi:hypothetical protein